MIRLVGLAVLVLTVLAAVACGGGDDSSSGDITIVPNMDRRADGVSEEEALELFKAIMERRAEFSDGSADVTINDDGTLSVDYSDIPDDIAIDLYSTAGDLALRGPQRQGDDVVICLTGPGQEAYISFSGIVYDQIDGKFIPRCQLTDGSSANIAWEDIDVPGLGVITNGDIANVALQTETGPTIIVGFNQDGNLKLGSVTNDLVGLPLGIFIDGQLVAGPKVTEPIGNGQIAIAGFSLRDARILRAQLRAGEVPAPYTVTVDA